jgi:hypothetical protein
MIATNCSSRTFCGVAAGRRGGLAGRQQRDLEGGQTGTLLRTPPQLRSKTLSVARNSPLAHTLPTYSLRAGVAAGRQRSTREAGGPIWPEIRVHDQRWQGYTQDTDAYRNSRYERT